MKGQSAIHLAAGSRRDSPRRRSFRASRRPWLGLLVAAVVQCASARAAPTSEQVQAALVYKFAQFVEWPDGDGAANTPIQVGTLGGASIRSALEGVLRTKTIGGRGFEVHAYKRPEEVTDCTIIVIDAPEPRQEMILRALPKRGLLTIGDGASFARDGGVIAVIFEGDQVKFDINLAAAEEAGLTINATLLSLAREVGRW